MQRAFYGSVSIAASTVQGWESAYHLWGPGPPQAGGISRAGVPARPPGSLPACHRVKERLRGNPTCAVRHPVLQAMGFGSITFPWTCAQGKP